MALPTDDDCDACVPEFMKHRTILGPAVFVSWSPLILTFFLTFVFTVQKVVPLFTSEALHQDGSTGDFSIGSLATGLRRTSDSKFSHSRGGARKIATMTVGITVALTAVLGELVFCEVTGLLNTTARSSALRATISLLLVMLLTVIPSLEIHSLISSAGWSYSFPGSRSCAFRPAWFLHLTTYLLFLLTFWYVGDLMLAQHDLKSTAPKSASTVSLKEYASISLLDKTTSHIGVIGISLMALLSGFASVSSPWQGFFSRAPPVSDTTLARKKAGLDSAREMLATKKSRLRALEQKLSGTNQPPPRSSLLEKAASTFRGNPDSTERSNLHMEISGLENMQLGLSSSYTMLSTRYSQQQRNKTPTGRVITAAEQVFAIYCIYRIVTTLLSFLRRKLIGPAPMSGVAAMSTLAPDEQPGTFDPLMAVLGLVAPSSLDAAALSRQLTFLLSGLMLLASFSSVLQTFHLFARFAPWFLRAVNKNLPLIVAQVCGTYVISVALLLRGRLGSSGGEAERLIGVGGGELGWVDGWFEGWFLIGACITAAGIWAGRQVFGGEEWDDEGGDLESGKMS